MIMIKRLKRPTRRSGNPLVSGEISEVRGLVIVNLNPFTIYVDKFTPPRHKQTNKQRKY